MDSTPTRLDKTQAYVDKTLADLLEESRAHAKEVFITNPDDRAASPTHTHPAEATKPSDSNNGMKNQMADLHRAVDEELLATKELINGVKARQETPRDRRGGPAEGAGDLSLAAAQQIVHSLEEIATTPWRVGRTAAKDSEAQHDDDPRIVPSRDAVWEASQLP